jgi:hypothetical protein
VAFDTPAFWRPLMMSETSAPLISPSVLPSSHGEICSSEHL